MELHTGKMTTKELAEWFGVTPGSFRVSKKKKLAELKNFAEFESIPSGRGVIINEVLIPVYTNHLDDDLLYDAQVRARENHLTSIAGMARDLIEHDPKYKDVGFETLKKRLKKAGVRTYGVTNDKEKPGVYGTRKYVWAIKVDDYNHYRFKTQAEEEVYQNILKEYTDSIDVANTFEQRALIDQAVLDGEISAEEGIFIRKDRENFFRYVIGPFKEKTGLQLVKTTEHEVYESMQD